MEPNDFFDSDIEPDGLKREKCHELAPITEDLKPRDMIRSIMHVYRSLGGDMWLLEQAQAYPKEFMSLLKSILPKNVEITTDAEIKIMIEAPGLVSEEVRKTIQGRSGATEGEVAAVLPPGVTIQ